MDRVNVIGAGKVGQTLLGLLDRTGGYAVGDVLTRRADDPFRTVEALDQMRPAALWALTVPDDSIAAVAQALAARQGPPATAFHCSGFLTSELLAPLEQQGWQVASCHPALSFSDPALALGRFAGTPCGIEGDSTAVARLRQLVSALGGQPFDLTTEGKALYHAAAVFSNNFTTVLQAVALDAWAEAGVAPQVAQALCANLLDATAANVARLGPAAALTGPAARGDLAVIARQQEVVAAWNPEAAAVYRLMIRMARRLSETGTI